MELAHETDPFDSVDNIRYDVVKLHNDSPIDSMTESQKKKVDRFYELLANAMPLEGRDYSVEFEPQSNGVSVFARVVGKNELGNAFSRQVAEYWRRFGSH